MQIITRKVSGGFQARFNNDKKFAQGRTREEAIGKLITLIPHKVGVTEIRWDDQHTWTRNYLTDKGNRRHKGPYFTIDTTELPPTTSSENARKLLVRNLPIHPSFRKALFWAHEKIKQVDYNPHQDPWQILTLGDITNLTRDELRAARRFGKKKLELLDQLLKHYRLSLCGE